MYTYDLFDILFFIKSIQNSSHHFDIWTFSVILLGHLPVTSFDRFLHHRMNKEIFTLTDYLVHLTTYLQST